MTYQIAHADCRELLARFRPDTVDAFVQDPPYGLAFMGKTWDHAVPGPEYYAAQLRVAKPGAHLVAFGGTRTYHRLACAIEDAGWELRDCLMWLYGSGFPKSHNVAIAIDKQRDDTDAARQWEGYGTALKPGWEPIILARKPFTGTVAANVLEHGTGALNIDGCRVGERWPANVVMDPEAGAMLDAQTGTLKSGAWDGKRTRPKTDGILGEFTLTDEIPRAGDSGGASRFFYCAKAAKKEREAGLENFTPHTVDDGRAKAADNAYQRGATQRHNGHPTVKPIALMRWLVRLVTPPGGLVVDPFCGSGSTGCAAVAEGFDFLGIEREADFVALADARVRFWSGE